MKGLKQTNGHHAEPARKSVPEKELFELIEISLGEKKFNISRISKLLKNNNILVKRSALELIKDHYSFDFTEKLVELIFDPDEKVRILAINTLKMDPFFAFEKRQEFIGAEITPGPRNIYLEKLFSPERTEQFSKIIKRTNDSDFFCFLEDFAWIPGVENLDLDYIFSDSKKKFRKTFQTYRRSYFLNKYPPQISLVPSYHCNLDCFYCFAHDLNRVFPDEMTLGQFKQVLNTINSEGVIQRVGILGGEPVLFPDINGFIGELKKRQMDFYLATNGIVDPAIFADIINHENLLTLTVHIERDEFYTAPQLRQMLTNIENIGKNHHNAVIRYNLLKPSRGNWNFLKKYMELLPDFIFSFAVVFPSQSGRVNMVKLEKLKNFSKKIISLLTFLDKNNRSSRIRVAFAKPFPPCAFSEDELKFVLKNAVYKNVCELDKNQFTNNICINPDLSFFSCMALTDKKYRGEKILPLEDLKTKNKSLAGFLVNKPLLKDCEDCYLFGRGVCQAACYAYVD